MLTKFDIFPREVEKRADIGNRYSAMIQEQCPDIVTPFNEEWNCSVYAQYTIRVNNRTRVQENLKEKGIPTAVHYPIPLHKQPVFTDQNVSLPVSEELSERVFSLPMHPLLNIETQQMIVTALKDFTAETQRTQSNFSNTKGIGEGIGGGIFEHKINYGPGYRIY